MTLTPAEKRSAQEIFQAGNACEDCGGIHKRACPRIKRQVWIGQGSGAGARTEVEYWAEYDQTGIIWPEDAYDPEDGDGADGR